MKYLYTLLFLTLIGCSNKPTSKSIQNLNGYWDIELVESNSKKTTKFGANTTVDYFYLAENNIGYRKKTVPDFSGKYKSNNRKDSISIITKDDIFYILTKTEFDSWQETIITLTPKKLVLKNNKGDLFHYKRHEKFNFN